MREELLRMARTPAPMVHLGYGKWVRADRVFAVLPIEGHDRGDGRRTLVHVDGMAEPLVASRSERAIVTDLGTDTSTGRAAGAALMAGQDPLF